MYQCDNCGNVVAVRPNSGRCAICTGRLAPKPTADNPTWEPVGQEAELACYLCRRGVNATGTDWNGLAVCLECHALNHYQKAKLAIMQEHFAEAEAVNNLASGVPAVLFGVLVGSDWIRDSLSRTAGTIDKATWELWLAASVELSAEAAEAFRRIMAEE